MKTKADDQLWDVVIYEMATGTIDAIIGTNMRRWDGEGSGRNTADLRLETGLERINEHYDCLIVEAGKYKKGDAIA